MVNRDTWVPTSESSNTWTSVGNYDPELRLCRTHQDLVLNHRGALEQQTPHRSRVFCCPKIPKHILKVGDKVVVKYPPYRGKTDNKNWFAATVTSIFNDKVNVKYEDGDYGHKVLDSEIFYAPDVTADIGKGNKRFNDIGKVKEILNNVTPVEISGIEVESEWMNGKVFTGIINLGEDTNVTLRECLDKCKSNKHCTGITYSPLKEDGLSHCWYGFGQGEIKDGLNTDFGYKKSPTPYQVSDVWKHADNTIQGSVGKVFWGSDALEEHVDVKINDCFDKCKNNDQCSGATFNPKKG